MGKPSTLTIYANVKKLIDGSPIHPVDIRSSDFTFGLGAAGHLGMKNFGEAMIWEGECHQTEPEESGLYQKMPQKFTTPFFMGVRNMPQDIRGHQLSFSPPKAVEDIYADYAQGSAIGYFFVGFFEFSLLEGVYLKKPPIYEEDIIGHCLDDYIQPSPSYHNQAAAIFGSIILKKSKAALKLRSEILKAFYASPKEKNSPVLSHTHAMLLDEPYPSHLSSDYRRAMQHLRKKKWKEVYHLLPHSRISKGVYFIEEIKKIETFS